MTDPLDERQETLEALQRVLTAAEEYLVGLPDRLVWDESARSLLDELSTPLPEAGVGTLEAVTKLLRIGTSTATASAGPRFFHFVIGGSTPASLAADWTVSMLDQNAFVRASSWFADAVETAALRWLCDLVELPKTWGGVLTPSATFANVTCLGLATHWWAEQHGVDYADEGLSELPRMPVLGSGYLHPSARKALQLLGHGRSAAGRYCRDSVGRVDLAALEQRLVELDGAPAVVIATAGEPNAGDFDPIDDLADLAERYNAWLHVDGAFGLFAALSPTTDHLTAGIERADSIAADAHKWLNVPYESGFALARSPERLGSAFGMPGAAYLPGCRRSPGRLRTTRTRIIPAGSWTTDLGNPGSLRTQRVPRACRAALRACAVPGSTSGRRTGPGTARRGAPEHRLLPLPAERSTRNPSLTASTGP